MKRLLMMSGLLSAFMLVVWAAVPAADFSGTWALDAAKSEGLPQQMQVGHHPGRQNAEKRSQKRDGEY